MLICTGHRKALRISGARAIFTPQLAVIFEAKPGALNEPPQEGWAGAGGD